MDASLCRPSPLLAPPLLWPAALLQLLNPPTPPSGIRFSVATPSSQTRLNSRRESAPRRQPRVHLSLTPLPEAERPPSRPRDESSLAAVKTAPSPFTSTGQSATCCCVFLPVLLQPPLPLLPSPRLRPLLSSSTATRKSQTSTDGFLTQTSRTWMMKSERGGAQTTGTVKRIKDGDPQADKQKEFNRSRIRRSRALGQAGT